MNLSEFTKKRSYSCVLSGGNLIFTYTGKARFLLKDAIFLEYLCSKILEKYENNTLALEDAGIAYAIDQIVDLITSGVDGIHLYTMNKTKAAIRIYEAVKHLPKEENEAKNVL